MAAPPVVKFLDFGQYKYDLTKREKEAKRKQRSVTFKEVRLSPKIGTGDFDTKVHRAIEFLEDGDRIKVTVRFRGRELTHPELGRNLIARFVGSGQGARRGRTDAAAGRQVDAHHDGIAAQAEDTRRTGSARRRGERTEDRRAGRTAAETDRDDRHRPNGRRRRQPTTVTEPKPKTEPKTQPDRRRCRPKLRRRGRPSTGAAAPVATRVAETGANRNRARRPPSR